MAADGAADHGRRAHRDAGGGRAARRLQERAARTAGRDLVGVDPGVVRRDGPAGRLADLVDHHLALHGARGPGPGAGRAARLDHRADRLSLPKPARVPADPLVLLPAAGQGARLGPAAEPAEVLPQPALAAAAVLR